MKVLFNVPKAEFPRLHDAMLRGDDSLEVRIWSREIPTGWADCVVTAVLTEPLLQCLADGGFLHSYGAGVDGILSCPGLRPEIPIARVVDDTMTLGMTQYIVLAVLRWVHKADNYRLQQTRHEWARLGHPDTRDFPVGILGMGNLGSSAAKALTALGFTVHGWRRRDNEAGDLFDFLSRSRILVCLAPLTKETDGLLDLKAMYAMPRGSYLINCGRGAVLREDDLMQAIDGGHIAGAALDVMRQEPLPADSPLWDRPEIIVTPHIATFPTAPVVAAQVLRNLKRHAAKQPLENMARRELGY